MDCHRVSVGISTAVPSQGETRSKPHPSSEGRSLSSTLRSFVSAPLWVLQAVSLGAFLTVTPTQIRISLLVDDASRGHVGVFRCRRVQMSQPAFRSCGVHLGLTRTCRRWIVTSVPRRLCRGGAWPHRFSLSRCPRLMVFYLLELLGVSAARLLLIRLHQIVRIRHARPPLAPLEHRGGPAVASGVHPRQSSLDCESNPRGVRSCCERAAGDALAMTGTFTRERGLQQAKHSLRQSCARFRCPG